MTRRRLAGQFGKAIEAAFTPYNLVPGLDDPPVLKVMSFEEFLHLQTEEILRIGSKIVLVDSNGVILETIWSQDGERLAITFMSATDTADIFIWDVHEEKLWRATL